MRTAAVPQAQLVELGRLVVAVVSTTIESETGSALLAALFHRFGDAWVQQQLDYHRAILAASDAAADVDFPKKG